MTKREQVQEELEEIAQQHNGILYPADVVEFAKDENTALHNHFEWDDSEAAQHYRLWQARQVIRIHVTVLEEAKQETRLFVSVKSDRVNGGGYRFTADVMSDVERRRELLKEAGQSFNFWRKKYQELKELVPVFEAMDRVMVELPEPELAKAA
jgi:hypothetical protein